MLSRYAQGCARAQALGSVSSLTSLPLAQPATLHNVPMLPRCRPGRRESEVVRSAATTVASDAPPATSQPQRLRKWQEDEKRQISNASPASARTSLSSCGAVQWTSHAMLIMGRCGLRAGARASTSTTHIPVCSTSLKRHEEGGNPFAKMVAPPSRSHRTCHGVCKQRAGPDP